MDSKLEKRLMSMVDEMPPFPKSVHRVIELTNDLNCAPKDLVQVIEHDPVITMKLLKLVNSAYFSLAKSIASVRHALVYLGLNTVKNLALSIATVGALPRSKSDVFDSNAFLLHSLTTAAIAQRLSKEHLGNKDATDVFVAGLLHDFGKAVAVQFMPQEFSQAVTKARQEGISLHEAEMDVIGADHTQIGAMLAETWQLPSELVESIRNHHQPELLDDDGMCIFIANQISKKMEFGFSGNPQIDLLPDTIMARFGGMDLDALIESLGDMTEEVEKAESFIYM